MTINVIHQIIFLSCSSPYSWFGGLPPGGLPPPVTGGGSASSCGEGKEKDESKGDSS